MVRKGHFHYWLYFLLPFCQLNMRLTHKSSRWIPIMLVHYQENNLREQSKKGYYSNRPSNNLDYFIFLYSILQTVKDAVQERLLFC